MRGYESTEPRRFYRSSDNRVIGGVCGGIADYFGFNVRATRFIAFIALFTPFNVIAFISYIAAMILLPSAPTRVVPPDVDEAFHKAMRSSPQQTMNDVRRRFLALDRRLARLEKYVTSSRYNLDREFRDLER